MKGEVLVELKPFGQDVLFHFSLKNKFRKSGNVHLSGVPDAFVYFTVIFLLFFPVPKRLMQIFCSCNELHVVHMMCYYGDDTLLLIIICNC
jgi:hypothetical protein